MNCSGRYTRVLPKSRPSLPTAFATRVKRWQRAHGRHDLPWQASRDPYRIWISEIMLQQTQVATVIPYYVRFLARFPTVRELAAASEDEVLGLWSGLGYYARARNLHRAAKEVVARSGIFPARFEALAALPGIGRSTAGAIAAFASGERRAILDGNVRRVLARHAGIGGDPASAKALEALWAVAESRLPVNGIEAYAQGLMDLGAGVCTVRAPRCDACPVAIDCVARAEDRIGELPGKRRRAATPRRRVAMLVAVSRGEVLLEKRAAKGLWGGLWSLPEAEPGEPPADVLLRDWGLVAERIERLDPFEHAFTHFTLEVTPWRLRVRKPGRLAGEKRATWLALSELEGAALPAPVRRLLATL